MDLLIGNHIIRKAGRFLEAQALEIILTLAIIFLLGMVISKLADTIQEDWSRLRLKKWTRYGTFLISFFWLIMLYNIHSNDEGSFPLLIPGILLAGMAFTLRGVFSSIIGWLMIASHNGFHEGDRIEVHGVKGDVIDIGILRTTLAEIGDWEEWGEQSTGKLISVPNSSVLEGNVVNYSRGFDTMWSELAITVTFESDWQRAETILNEIALADFEEHEKLFAENIKSVKREYMVSYTYITPKVYVKIVEEGVTLTLRHMVLVRERRIIFDKISRKVLEAFEKESIVDFAYPTIRFYR